MRWQVGASALHTDNYEVQSVSEVEAKKLCPALVHLLEPRCSTSGQGQAFHYPRDHRGTAHRDLQPHLTSRPLLSR